mmetsp:Transcript_21304/g.40367  ORF Transcript_21304/g.40367 Transcript_21304/m.40367 type:complete len:103 (+) Transcript_21304:33-341(+)
MLDIAVKSIPFRVKIIMTDVGNRRTNNTVRRDLSGREISALSDPSKIHLQYNTELLHARSVQQSIARERNQLSLDCYHLSKPLFEENMLFCTNIIRTTANKK